MTALPQLVSRHRPSGPPRHHHHGPSEGSSATLAPATREFVPPHLVEALPEEWLADALHTQLDGSRRSLCIVHRLAHSIRIGKVRCDGVDIGWLPPQSQLRVYSESRWGQKVGSEGRAHRDLRAVASMFLAAAQPDCRLTLPPQHTPAGRRRADLVASKADGRHIVVELGAVDADSVHLQLNCPATTHALVLPYAGASVRRVCGYVFRPSLIPPLRGPSEMELRDAWSALLTDALTDAARAPLQWT